MRSFNQVMVPSVKNFICYSLPGSQNFEVVHQNDFGTKSEPPIQGKYVIIRPFDSDEGAIFIEAEIRKELNGRFDNSNFSKAEKVKTLNEEEYLDLVQSAVASCNHTLDKIVVSRAVDKNCNTANWINWLRQWKIAFPQAFIYMMNTEKFGAWMGATPELLVRCNHHTVETMALAGTVWGLDEFSEKERTEHEAVIEDIKSIATDPLIISPTKQMTYGEIKHLQTNLSWETKKSVFEVAEELHPTPAVCGRPRREAMRFILEKENRPRLLYTGYIGLINEGDLSNVFVNLRCMQLFRDRIRIHVGGGVNAKSDPKKEWEETERKMEAMLNMLNLND